VTECALTFGAPCLIHLYFFSCVSLPLSPSGAPLLHFCAAGEGCLRLGAVVRK
jgi:hypothetical protein